MSIGDFTLLPAQPTVTPDDDLNAAAQNALAVPAGVHAAAPTPETPLGRSWSFDWQAGQFRRIGQSPAEVLGLDAVAEWAQMALHTARYSSPFLSDDFGVEQPDRVIGELATAALLADWQAAVVDALLVHDRVTAVQNVKLGWDPTSGILTVLRLDIVTDAEQIVTVSDVTMQLGGQ